MDRQKEINLSFAEKGVIFEDIHNAYIEEGVTIGSGTYIGPGVIIKGGTAIGKGCRFPQGGRIEGSEIGDGVTIDNSVVLESSIGDGTGIGPFAYVRPGSRIGGNVRIGDFVEIKNSTIGDGSKASHLTYVGDADLGQNVNLGCGVVFVNYDGREKHRSAVGDGAFIGCNVNIISPVHIGEGAYIAAGTTVTRDVPAGALAIARSEMVVKEGWTARKGYR
ncbi:MAG: UDP-N-acetylglucosamine diphosphorylase [Clostridiales Family XIII bacterium]|jgi:bifunctional UDP-N-acetylglucosamine pyrophosphorylase/glucosamine-1-phosphate N-acetyltransferase|nr:UDP-N-acetylglucosamine diphosphorylase [Clostridiales Family XIII bacterium]